MGVETKTFNFPESYSRTQNHSVQLPSLLDIDNASVNTGSVSVVEVSGESVEVRVTGGSYSRKVLVSGSYTPSDSKQASTTRSGEQVRDKDTGVITRNDTPPSSVYYSSGGYSGTLNATHATYGDWVSVGSVEGRSLTRYYSGTVTKPSSDTRNYDYKYQYDVTLTYTTNDAPDVLLKTSDNQTLYEDDTITIDGEVSDIDGGDVVNVYYQINSNTPTALKTSISDNGAPILFNKQLTFKEGKLHISNSAITAELSEGTEHFLKVWATDDKGGKSSEKVISFYVVPNRPPTLTIDSLSDQANLINHDSITISGSTSDPEGNEVTVSYKLNGSLKTQVASGAPGNWSFDIQLKDMADGENNITIEVVDSYGFKTSKTLTVNKAFNPTPLTYSVARYRIEPPAGSAKGLMLWVQREVGDLIVGAEISMTQEAEQENFVPMTLSNSAPVNQSITEDEFVYQEDTAKEKIIVKLTLDRTDTNSKEAIKLISGVIDQ